MENEVTDLSNLVPNLSRFSFKAKSELGYWIFGRLEHDYKGQWGLSWGCPKENMNTDMDPYTICQCTGAKDSKGNLIYENDIIQRKDGGVVTNEYLVVYNPNTFNYKVKGKGETDWSDFSFIPLWLSHGVELVVIGNKFDKEKTDD